MVYAACAVSTTLLAIFLSLLCATIFVLVEIVILRRFLKRKQEKERKDEGQLNDYEPVERGKESENANDRGATPKTPANKPTGKISRIKLIAVKKNQAYETHS